jgi:hypothetical protein
LRQGLLQLNQVSNDVSTGTGGIGKQPVPNGTPLSQYREYVKYVWMNVPYAAIPRNYITKCSNKVNKNWFDGYPPGTLLYSSAELEPLFSPLGYRTMNVTHNFIFKPNVSQFLYNHGGTLGLATDIAMGWNSEPAVINTSKVSAGSTFYYWPMSGSGAPIDLNPSDPIFPAFSTRTFNGTEPFSLIDFAPLFAPEMG